MPMIRWISSMAWLGDLAYKPRKTLRRIGALLEGRAEIPPVRNPYFAIALPLEDESLHRAVAVQEAIYRRFGYNPALEGLPHISIKLWFQCPEVKLVEFFLAEQARQTEPIVVTMPGFGFFDEHQIMFLDVADNPALEELRQRTTAGLRERFGIEPYPIEIEGYRFHVTVSRGHSRREFKQLREEFGKGSHDLTFTARRIELIAYLGGRWVPVWSGTLGSPQTEG